MKRCADFVLSLFAIIAFSPVMLILAFIVFYKIGQPIFFFQSRPGLHGKLFKMVKFRTMNNEHDENGMVLADNERLTLFGKRLRSSSLDELPELWNVLKGDMSLVGPRPLLIEYLPLYNEKQSRRHEVRPGITGWAQVNGRNAISWDEKFELDVWYVENQSFWLDIKILFMTVIKTLHRENVTACGEATMTKFMGNEQDIL